MIGALARRAYDAVLSAGGSAHPIAALESLSPSALTVIAERATALSQRARLHLDLALGQWACSRVRPTEGDEEGPVEMLRAAPGNAVLFADVLDAVEAVDAPAGWATPRRNEQLRFALARWARAGLAGQRGFDWSHAEDGLLKRAQAFTLALTSGMAAVIGLSNGAAEDALIAVLQENLHRAGELASLIVERRTLDPAVIAAFVSGPAHALADGAL